MAYSIFKIINNVECIAHTDAIGNGRLIIGGKIVAVFHDNALINPVGAQYVEAGWKKLPRTDNRVYNQKGSYVGSPRLVEYLPFDGNFSALDEKYSNAKDGKHILPEALEAIFNKISQLKLAA